MIVVAIVAILSAIAIPAYTNYVVKSHRVAAEGCLSEYANYMERYYTTNMRYDQSMPASPSTSTTPVANTLGAAGLDCATTQRTGANYTYDFPAGAASATTYIVEAVPFGAQRTRDSKCGTLSLDQAGTRKASLDPAGTAGCW
jgi:type IV pilus assembly protein PilE